MFEGRQINESPSLVYRLCKTYPLVVIFLKPVSSIYLDFFSLRRFFFAVFIELSGIASIPLVRF